LPLLRGLGCGDIADQSFKFVTVLHPESVGTELGVRGPFRMS
jgi:hypothetical protein